MWFYILIAIFTKSITCQDYTQIEDIPIENFDPVDLQENDMDLELLPRIYRSSLNRDDPKELFFRSLRLSDDSDETLESSDNIPKPGGFRTYYQENLNKRSKRQTPDVQLKVPAVSAKTSKKSSTYGLVKSLGKPLELSVLNPENSTEKVEETPSTEAETTESTTTAASVTVEQPETKQEQDNVLINDFIRFRRATTSVQLTNTNTSAQNYKSESLYPSSDEPFSGHSEKLVMEPMPTDSPREARRVTQEEWVKQVYPVRRSDELSFDDNVPASSEAIRAPRVHFVTQKLSESSNVPEFRSFEREPRARSLRDPYIREFRDMRDMRDLARDFSREVDYYQPRYPRQPPGARYPDYRDDRYYRYDNYRDPREIYRPRYQNYEMLPTANYQKQKQKRIIYYATLPEVPRSPPNADLRDRYGYRERDRYEDPYPYRKQDYPKSRYEETDRSKTPYPVKVSADVNVREVKKNPERRIYSEVDNGRYAFKQGPYQADAEKF